METGGRGVWENVKDGLWNNVQTDRELGITLKSTLSTVYSGRGSGGIDGTKSIGSDEGRGDKKRRYEEVMERCKGVMENSIKAKALLNAPKENKR